MCLNLGCEMDMRGILVEMLSQVRLIGWIFFVFFPPEATLCVVAYVNTLASRNCGPVPSGSIWTKDHKDSN